MQKRVFLFIALLFVGCAATNDGSYEQNTCTNNVPLSDKPFKEALAASITKRAQAAYTRGYPEVEIDIMLFDQFYAYYRENAYYESGCSPTLDEKRIEKKFKKFAVSAMVEGRSRVDDPHQAMTQDEAKEILQMSVKEMFALVNNETNQPV